MKFPKLHIGWRTVKTSLAVIASMFLIEILGTTDSRIIFAMLGAMDAVQPTFKESVEAILSQVIGMVFGTLCSVLLCALPLPPLVAVGIGIILIITLYNLLNIRFSPGLPIFVLVLACTAADVEPFSYALGRMWDTAIGLAVGMAINMLVAPYDNSRQIRAIAWSLDKELLRFLEEYFDGDDILPESKQMRREIDTLERQLRLFANQKLLLRLRQQNEELAIFQACEKKAQALISHMEVLSTLEAPGRLNDENRRKLEGCGADIRDQRPLVRPTEQDAVTNYHVAQLLKRRQELLEVLQAEV